jgi:hypothetical protein
MTASLDEFEMSLSKRIDLYKKIEDHRGRPLIVYVTSKRSGWYSMMSSDSLPYLIRQLDSLPAKTEAIDLLIASYGGDPMVAWRISTLLRQRVQKVSVLIPQSAYSAATLVALGANEIFIHPNGHLGPVDMQIAMKSDTGQSRMFSTEDISAFLDFVRDNLKITDQEHLRALFEITCREVGSLGIGFTARSSKLAIDLGERLLGLHMKDDDSRSKLRMIVENMSRKFQSHSYPVNRQEAKDIGLAVNPEQDAKLEKLMWDIWLDIEEDLMENTPFDPIRELLNSTEATKLLAPVPQLDLPLCASASADFHTTIADVFTHATTKVEPVDFEVKDALVESSRAAYAHVNKGKILSHRTPDLVIRYHVIIKSSSWEEVPAPTTRKERKTS